MGLKQASTLVAIMYRAGQKSALLKFSRIMQANATIANLFGWANGPIVISGITGVSQGNQLCILLGFNEWSVSEIAI